ncbi:zinc finger CCCH domain-containing protein 3 [Engystomops pustulosus]|uniref:zinc finger CCCH domain-containing protein 3 n=1 Tax=Engystomops pustulosus TaxID=76066 RepID=UPI003AFA8CB2
MDEEKESLRRQIQLLQGLIDSHKIIHGNAPAATPAATPRWQTASQPPGGFQGRGGYPQPQPNHNSWRKKYSLVNRTAAAELPGDIQRVPGRAKISGNKNQPADVSSFKWQRPGPSESLTRPGPSESAAAPSTSAQRGARPITSGSHNNPGHSQGSHKEILRGTAKTCKPLTITAPTQVLARPQPPVVKPPVPLPKTEVICPAPKPNVGSLPQRSNEAVTANRVTRSQKTKYRWVADSPRAPPKKVSPAAKKVSIGEKLETPTKVRKDGANPKTAAQKNRYKWKAESIVSSTPNRSPASNRGAPRSGPATPQHNKASGVATAASFKTPTHSSYKVKSKTKIIKRRSTSRSPADKKSSPLAPLMMKSHYSLRRRSSPRVKSPCTVKRISPRGLVHISKHRLRRLPPSGKQPSPPVREAAASSAKSSSSSRVIKTRYRIVKRSTTPPLVTSPLSTLSVSLNWRTRLLLLNRLRQNQNQQRWRSRGLCVIGGAMYRVSANKLSKAWSPGSGSKTTPKTGKLDSSSTSPGSVYPSRSATPSRYIASRAIQRSLAIIRQAQQKKEKKEYCMYYNRFGKCNRGQKCPYIHDPEKVAVCTRFLRGTCKKTDGTCPFSHQVSKDKMPVCSYFLKGICHNNDCPYSHVYVSRKAEVCPDFLKGYCPMGAKCKKKHTLLCPDFARDGKCPQGSKCKLQHRQRKRRPDPGAQPEPAPPNAKQRRKMQPRIGTPPAPAGDPPSSSDDELPGSSGLQSCPSFISLNMSSASEGTPTSERVQSSENSGKPLQIKPRL